MNRPILLLGIALLFAGCTSTPEPQPVQMTVFYGTDRQVVSAENPEDTYGAALGVLTFGSAEVSIPPDHRMGRIEEPSLMNFEFSPQEDRHVVLRKVLPELQPTFLARLQDQIRKTGNESVFIFVHGYNVSFAGAARRTAQIAYDLEWPGTAVFYSWPSHASTDVYGADRDNALAAVADLTAFIESVAVYSGAAKVHVIAHSMGNEPLLTALARHAASTSSPGVPLVDEVVLAAPDVGADEFRALIAKAAPAAHRFTLYVSANDTALQASSLVNEAPRAGDSSGGVLVLPGVDTIDASAAESDMVGHSYYGESRVILADVFSLLKTGMSPDQRFGLHAASVNGQKYWILQP
ncbi:MAG TPA: alpha/beta hydrolase [Dongiaceae bacterium]|jgi:esterase/lipase superfamily enzyme